MGIVKIWIRAIRAPFLSATIAPIGLGAAIGWAETQSMHWTRFLLALAGGICIHIGVNLSNDYFDHLSRNDWNNLTPTPFSGGSRIIQNGDIRPGWMLAAALISFGIGSSIGLYLNHILLGNVILYIGIIGVALGFFYTGWPARIGYRGFGLGELATGLGFGPLMAAGSYYVQTQWLDATPFLASAPLGLMIGLVLYINEFPDYEADKSVGKKTLPVMMGKERAAKLFYLILISAYFYTTIMSIAGIIPIFGLIILLTLPLAIKVIRITMRQMHHPDKLIPANAAMVMTHLAFGTGLIAAYILEGLLMW